LHEVPLPFLKALRAAHDEAFNQPLHKTMSPKSKPRQEDGEAIEEEVVEEEVGMTAEEKLAAEMEKDRRAAEHKEAIEKELRDLQNQLAAAKVKLTEQSQKCAEMMAETGALQDSKAAVCRAAKAEAMAAAGGLEQAKVEAQGMLDSVRDVIEPMFDLYDLDDSGIIDTPDEINQLTTAVQFKLKGHKMFKDNPERKLSSERIAELVEEIIARTKDSAEDLNVEKYTEWFSECVREAIIQKILTAAEEKLVATEDVADKAKASMEAFHEHSMEQQKEHMVLVVGMEENIEKTAKKVTEKEVELSNL